MTLRILFLLGCTTWFAPAQQSACRSVEGDRIRAQDLAAALPEFSAVPPETLLGQAPLPGTQHILHSSELRALARRFGFDTSAPDVCFEWPMQQLDRERALSAMQESLGVDGAKIEIADMFSDRVPPGRIDFPLTGLGKPSPTGPSAPVLWRGDVVYGDNHRFAVWARVGITAACRRLVAAESLRSGKPIERSQIRETTISCFPVAAKESPAVADVAGMLPVHPIAAGGEIRSEFLVPPNDINSGESVRIEVRSGAARLSFSAKALTGGRSGEFISVRNPDSNRTFQARITGKGTALVEVGGPKGI